MAGPNRRRPSLLRPSARIHIVLVPGFGGFDALGQLDYYAGITPLFRDWQKSRRTRGTVVLHYFDNFPTASVAARATRLQQYLAKRIARGEFSTGDRIALVGHSTGGLDIRRMLCNLADPTPMLLDGTTDENYGVKPKQILDAVTKIVFLSVPQWGTNIADWMRAHRVEREFLIADLRAAVELSQVPIADRLQRWTATRAARLLDTNLFYAIRDAIREAEADTMRDEVGTADAQEAASLLALWLRHIATDFAAIDDLRAADPASYDDVEVRTPATHKSPAHFSLGERRYERNLWHTNGIEPLSFATRAPNPFSSEAHGSLWEVLNWPNREQGKRSGSDAVYRFFYGACAKGPFVQPPNTGTKHFLEKYDLEVWHNDGIVNTASMLWPNGDETVIEKADHMDIVGHRELIREARPGDREYHSYDLMVSGAHFTANSLARVWTRVFDFCVRGLTARPKVRRIRQLRPVA